MSRKEFVLSIVACALLCGCSPSLHLSSATGEGPCGLTTLPGSQWVVDPEIEARTQHTLDFQDFDPAEFRASKADPVEILIAKRINFPTHGVYPISQYGLSEPVYSQDKYAFRLEEAGIARRIPDSVWEGATNLNKGKINQAASWSDEAYQMTASYGGRLFARSGQYAYGSNLSEHARLIAVYSYSGRQTPKEDQRQGSIVRPGVGPDPSKGQLFIDIYRVDSGAKVLGLSGAFSHGPPSTWTIASEFLSDSYFVIPARADFRSFVFCVVSTSGGGRL